MRCYEDVLRLDIAVDNMLGMKILKTIGNLRTKGPYCALF